MTRGKREVQRKAATKRGKELAGKLEAEEARAAEELAAKVLDGKVTAAAAMASLLSGIDVERLT